MSGAEGERIAVLAETVAALTAERDALREQVARVEALRDQLYREHDGSLVTSDYPMIARRLRAALHPTQPKGEQP